MSTEALKAKEKGNAAFRAENFPEAVGHYTEAMMTDPADATYPLNRAAAYLRLGKAIDAERDCSTALKLSQGHVKALYRRAQARIELGKLAEAAADLTEALKRDPGNATVRSEIQKVDKLLSGQGKTKVAPIDVGSTASQTPSRRRRVPIEIIEDDVSSTGQNQTTDTPSPVQSRSLKPEAKDVLPTPSPSPEREPSRKPNSDTSKASQESSRTPSTARGGIFRASGQHTLFRSPETLQPNAKLSNTPVRPDDSLQQAPLSLFEFKRGWELASPSERWDLLCKIPPQLLPSLFKTSLEAPLLVEILEVCSLAVTSNDELAIKERVRDYLHWFSRVPRFSTVALFLSKKEKDLARNLADAVGATEWTI